jgi:hypothetical protein
MRKLSCLIFILFTICSFDLIGQNLAVADNKGAARIKKTTLAVVLKKEDEKEMKISAGYPDGVANYKANVATYNQYIKEIVDQVWTFSPNISVITSEAAEKLKDNKIGNFSILEFKFIAPYSPSAGPNTPTSMRQISPKIPAFTIVLAKKPKDEIVTVLSTPGVLTKGFLTVLIKQCVAQLEDCVEKRIRYYPAAKKQIDKRSPELKNRTLVICQDWLDKKFDEEKNASTEKVAIQCMPVEVHELDNFLLSTEKEYACILPLYNGFMNTTSFFVFDPSDGRIMYYRPKGAVGDKVTFKTITKISEDIK